MIGAASLRAGLNYIWRLCTCLKYAFLCLACNAGHALYGVQGGVGIGDSPGQRFEVAQFMHLGACKCPRGTLLDARG